MRELNKMGKPTEKHTGQWLIGLVLFGLLGFTQIQCSETPSQNPIRDNLIYPSYNGENPASISSRL